MSSRVNVRRVAWAAIAVAVVAVGTLLVVRACVPNRVDERTALREFIRAHDALVAASGQHDETLADLVVEWYRCDKGGVTVNTSWSVPTSVPGAAAYPQGRFDAALAPLGISTGGDPDPGKAAGVFVRLTTQSESMQVAGDYVAVPDVTAGAKSARIELSSATLTVQAPCYDSDRRTPAHYAKALDPVKALAGIRGGTPPTVDAFDTREHRARPAGTALPTAALWWTGNALADAAEILKYGVPDVAGGGPVRRRYIEAGNGRQFDAGAVVLAVDDVACGAGEQRLTATVPTRPFGDRPATGSVLVNHWHELLEKHINGPANAEDWDKRTRAPRPVPLPVGAAVIAGSATSNGGALLRGTDLAPTLQVVSPCTRLATDPVFDGALRAAIRRGAAVTALASISSYFGDLLPRPR